nr:unnamed protein product [Callosobruchus analis]
MVPEGETKATGFPDGVTSLGSTRGGGKPPNTGLPAMGGDIVWTPMATGGGSVRMADGEGGGSSFTTAAGDGAGEGGPPPPLPVSPAAGRRHLSPGVPMPMPTTKTSSEIHYSLIL